MASFRAILPKPNMELNEKESSLSFFDLVSMIRQMFENLADVTDTNFKNTINKKDLQRHKEEIFRDLEDEDIKG